MVSSSSKASSQAPCSIKGEGLYPSNHGHHHQVSGLHPTPHHLQRNKGSIKTQHTIKGLQKVLQGLQRHLLHGHMQGHQLHNHQRHPPIKCRHPPYQSRCNVTTARVTYKRKGFQHLLLASMTMNDK